MRHLIYLPLVAGGLLLPGCARQPMSGEYQFERAGEIRGNCNLEDQMKDLEMDKVATVNVSPGGKTMSITHQGKDTTCMLDGNNFDCTFMDDVNESRDSTIRRTLKAIGTWTTDRTIEATMTYASTCTGNDCVEKAQAGDQFCNAEWDINGQLKQEGAQVGQQGQEGTTIGDRGRTGRTQGGKAGGR